MTREEAINTLGKLKRYISGGGVTDRKANKAIDMAIESLQAEAVQDEALKIGVLAILERVSKPDREEKAMTKWEMKPDPFGFFDDIPVCSECGCTTKMREKTKYCPNCGAKMDKGGAV